MLWIFRSSSCMTHYVEEPAGQSSARSLAPSVESGERYCARVAIWEIIYEVR